jgi:hypothetical protein
MLFEKEFGGRELDRSGSLMACLSVVTNLRFV